MTWKKRGRILYWLISDITKRYKGPLVLGVAFGLGLSFSLWQIFPLLQQRFFHPVARIGVVGEFNPSNLPKDIQEKISGGLTTTSESGETLPNLAARWEVSDSGKTYTFYLRPDYFWHTGQAVSASDINYNVKNVTFVVDTPLKIRAVLQTAYSPFLTLVSKPIFKSGLDGFGEYKVDRVGLKGDKVQHLRLVPREINSKNAIQEYKFYQTETQAVTAFKLGEIDKLDDLSGTFNLTGWSGITITPKIKTSRIVALYFNLQNELFKEKLTRQILGLSVPNLDFTPALSPISKSSWAYTDKVKIYPNQLETAKKALTSSALASDSAEIVLTTFSQYLDIAAVISESWNKMGIKSTVRVANELTDNYQILLSAFDPPPDPDQYPFWHSTQTQTNITGYNNVKIDKLLEDGRQILDRDERLKIYTDFQRRLVDDAPAIFLYYPTVYTIERN